MDDRTAGREDHSVAGPTETPPASEYDSGYYDTYGRLGPNSYTRENPHWLQFFGRVAERIIAELNPRTVLDVGCAKGFLVECLRDRGVEAYGFDVSEYAIGEVRTDIKPYCWVGSAGHSISKNYDLITCIEVCEHLQHSEAEETIRQMTLHSDTVLFSSTPSDFTEPTHINVHPIIDWVRLFAQFSYSPDQAFDGGFIAPQAMLFRRVQDLPSDQLLCRFASQINQAVGRVGMKTPLEVSALEQELTAIRNSKGWRLLTFYRELRGYLMLPLSRLKPLRYRHLSYEHWIKHVEQRAYDADRIVGAISKFQYKPKISLVTPVYNTPIEVLDSTIGSVTAQHYQNWELCLCDDGSPDAAVRQSLEAWKNRDARIKLAVSRANEGSSRASNRALELASGEFVGLLDHDDELSPDALYEVVKLLQMHSDADMIYSDEDRLDREGRRVRPFFKPDWSPEYMLARMYTCHFGVYRKQLLDELGGFRTGFEGSQDYDLVLRLSEKTDRIYHIPKILYHWRMLPGSASASAEAKPYAFVAARKALAEHLKRRQISGEVRDGSEPVCYRIEFDFPCVEKVSIIILSTDTAGEALRNCIRTLTKKTSYSHYQIIVLAPENLGSDIRQYLSSQQYMFVPSTTPLNPSRAINLGVTTANSNYIVLLHDDTEVLSADWITSMLGFCQQPEIGVVGAKLLYRNDLIEHAGVVLGLRGVAGHPLRKFPRDIRHDFRTTLDTRNCSAVRAACMMIRKNVFEKVGGFDEELGPDYNDVDFCLKVRKLGYRIVWTPGAELYHDCVSFEGMTKISREVARFQKRWGQTLTNDPYYNPNLTLRREDLGYGIRSK
jgi:GT2 family glycosyltransferase/2-polyprenyl-3-methyl-5-hydroxy-6-metoxy-1,4-benzoquinol methylase